MRHAWLCTLLAVICFSGAAAAKGVEAHHDTEADFRGYSTYEWSEGGPAYIPEIRGHLERRIDEQLQRAGLRKVSEGGDLTVVVDVVKATGGQLWGQYYKSMSWAWGFVVTDLGVLSEGTLIVTLVDAGANRAVWQGLAQGSFRDDDYQKMRNKVDKIVRRMFRGVPPEQ